MKFQKIFLWTVTFLINFNSVLSLNILAIFSYPGKSHFFVFEPYLKELARRGHNMTVISHFPQKQPIQNFKDISLAGKIEPYEAVFLVQRSYLSAMKIFLYINELARKGCDVMLASEEVQQLWHTKPNFDLVVVERFNTDCALGLAYKFGAPVVAVTSNGLTPWQYDYMGIPYNPSFMPCLPLEGGSKPTLFQRFERFILHNVANFMYKGTQSENHKQLQQYFDVPPLEDLVDNIKFLLVYTNLALTGPTILPTNVIEVAGYHIAKPKELPKELNKFIEDSEHGVIYISFGSMVNAATTPQDKIDTIVEVMSELPQRVVWKWDGDSLPGNPKNIYVSKWLPQNDILAHPKVVAFFSHCGLLGMMEALHYGVPTVGMPIFGDQPSNCGAMEENGLGLMIELKDLTKKNLLQKLKTVMAPEFKRNVKARSRLWHDRPLSPMDTAIYWTEFAARNKNFTFRSPSATMPSYQYYCLDMMLITIIILFSIIYVIKRLFVSLFKSKPVRKSTKVKTK